MANIIIHPGEPIKCLSIPIILNKRKQMINCQEVLTCGFKIGGGIDQDPNIAPYNYCDKVIQRTLFNTLI
ncbi:unnamed protein product [Gordionus sp. m RMFG-2023]